MEVIFTKDFLGHKKGSVLDVQTSDAKYLFLKEAAVEVSENKTTTNIEEVETEDDKYLETVEMLKTNSVKSLSYGEMQETVSVLGLKTNGATKSAMIEAIQEFKDTL